MNIVYSKQANKFILKQTKKTQNQIISAIEKIPLGDIKPLKGYPNLYRLRVRDFRILFEIAGNNLNIKMIDNRGDVYK